MMYINVNLKPRLLIKSGYYIVPSPSTDLTRGMASNPKMEYQVYLCIFQKNSAMATVGLKEMRKLLWEGREKGLPYWLSQFSK
jgi:hypothetical protein